VKIKFVKQDCQSVAISIYLHLPMIWQTVSLWDAYLACYF